MNEIFKLKYFQATMWAIRTLLCLGAIFITNNIIVQIIATVLFCISTVVFFIQLLHANKEE